MGGAVISKSFELPDDVEQLLSRVLRRELWQVELQKRQAQRVFHHLGVGSLAEALLHVDALHLLDDGLVVDVVEVVDDLQTLVAEEAGLGVLREEARHEVVLKVRGLQPLAQADEAYALMATGQCGKVAVVFD